MLVQGSNLFSGPGILFKSKRQFIRKALNETGSFLTHWIPTECLQSHKEVFRGYAVIGRWTGQDGPVHEGLWLCWAPISHCSSLLWHKVAMVPCIPQLYQMSGKCASEDFESPIP